MLSKHVHNMGLFGMCNGCLELQEELEKGVCVLTLRDDAIVRTVFVVALKICWGSKCLVKIAQKSEGPDDNWVPNVTLPGTKITAGQKPRDQVLEMMATDFRNIAEGITL